MMYLIYNRDGSIKHKQLSEYVQQGSNYANFIAVAFEDKDPTVFSLKATVVLPNDNDVVIALSTPTDIEVQGQIYHGRMLSLSSAATALAGTIQINVQALAIADDTVLTSYPFYMTVNPGVNPSDIAMMTEDQYNALIDIIHGYVTKTETIIKTTYRPSSTSGFTVGQAWYAVNSDHTIDELWHLESTGWEIVFDFNDHYSKDWINNNTTKVTGEAANGRWISLKLKQNNGSEQEYTIRGAAYTGSTGIEINQNTEVISLDFDVVATKTDIARLDDRIDAVDARGRYLSTWNASLGQPGTLPPQIATQAYEYHNGDYFIVSVEGTKVPTGSSVPAGTTMSTFPNTTGSITAKVNDTILYDGTVWSIFHSGLDEVGFDDISGSPYDNTSLATALNNMVDLDSDQEITGEKTFTQKNLKADNLVTGSADFVFYREDGTTAAFNIGNAGGVASTRYNFIPMINNNVDLGRSANQWRDGYFSGQVYAQNTFNVINASDIVSNTLSDAQYALITNGKPTLIKGTLLGSYNNPIITPPQETSTAQFAYLLAGRYLSTLYINKSTKVITLDGKYNGLVGIDSFNGKTIPAYPTANAGPQVLQIAASGGALSWSGDFATKAELEALKRDAYQEVDLTEYPTLADFLASEGEDGVMYLYPIDTSDLTKGYYRYIYENSAWQPMGTTQMDFSNYVDLTSAQTISGVKTFSNGINLANNYTVSSTTTALLFKRGTTPLFDIYGASTTGYFNIGLLPYYNNQKDIGSSSNQWKDIYLAGSLSDGTVSFTIAESYSQFNPNESSANLEIKWTKMLSFSKTSDSVFTLETAKTNCLCEYKALITNGANASITLTFTGVNNIICNDENVMVAGNTMIVPTGMTLEVNIVNGNMIAMNFAANQ